MDFSKEMARLESPCKDVDNVSTTSRGSYFQPSYASTNYNSDSEPNNGHSLSVREMIRHYNTVAKINKHSQRATGRRGSTHTLPSARYPGAGLDNSGGNNSVRHCVQQFQDNYEHVKPLKTSRSCNNFRKIECCCGGKQCRNRKPTECSFKEDNQNQLKSQNKCPPPCHLEAEINAPKLQTDSMRTVISQDQNRLASSLDSSTYNDDEGNTTKTPTETSYHSKTTIAKTSSGVRIIIDIYFDQDLSVSATDVVGSRVETDIPQSRILTEFQEQVKSASYGHLESN